MSTSTSQGRAIVRYKIHWHAMLVHFPISFFGVAFGFQVLHFFLAPACLEPATNLALIAGAVAMVPTTWTGWSAWKNSYKRARVLIFQRKITVSFIMLGLSVALVGWRVIALGLFEEHPESIVHWPYMTGNSLLIIGAALEGWYGGRLNHR